VCLGEGSLSICHDYGKIMTTREDAGREAVCYTAIMLRMRKRKGDAGTAKYAYVPGAER
jgi:hypothetical protein